MSEFDRSLPGLAKKWRTEYNDFTLHQAKNILNLSIGYISDLERGKVEFSKAVFLSYHLAEPDLFPMTLASELPFKVNDVNGATSQNKGSGDAVKGGSVPMNSEPEVNEEMSDAVESGPGDAGVPSDAGEDVEVSDLSDESEADAESDGTEALPSDESADDESGQSEDDGEEEPA